MTSLHVGSANYYNNIYYMGSSLYDNRQLFVGKLICVYSCNEI